MSFLPTIRTGPVITVVAIAVTLLGCASPAMVDGTEKRSSGDQPIAQEARGALKTLTGSNDSAARLAEEAKAVLVFPSVTKAGFMVGGYRGDGVLLKDDSVSGYYETTGASYGLQAGIQRYGYALFLMSDKAMKYIDETQGWEIGVGPSVVIVDEGKAKTLTTTTGREDVYAFVFSQKGLMAGMGLQGSKISRVN